MRSNVVDKSIFCQDGKFFRLDAEFVDPVVLGAELKLRTKPGWRLAKIVMPNAMTSLKDPIDQEQLVAYVSIDSVDTDDGIAFPEPIKFVDLPSRAKYLVAEGDILVSNVRPNRGGVCLVGKRIRGAIASSGFSLLRLPESSLVSREFTFAFLKTEHARSQLVRRNRGSMYPAVVGDDVHDLWVPQPPKHLQDAVRSTVQKALKAQEKFYSFHEKMTVQLSDFLAAYGLPPSPLEGLPTGVDWTQIDSSHVFGSGSELRFDAEFFRSGYTTFEKHVRELGPSFLLGEYFDLSPGRVLGEGKDEVPYIKQAVLTNFGVNWSAVAYEPGTPGPNSGRVSSGDILLACTAHEIYYVGRKVDFVRSVPEDLRENNTCVPDLMIVRPRKKKPAYVFGSFVAAFLRHPAGLHQAQRCIRGLRGGHVYKNDLSKHVRVPLPTKKWLEKFERLAVQMEAARNDAKETMKGAFIQVDTFIAGMV